MGDQPFFDTVKVGVKDAVFIANKATDEGVNLRQLDDKTLTISIDETTTLEDIDQLLYILNNSNRPDFTAESLAGQVSDLCHLSHYPLLLHISSH